MAACGDLIRSFLPAIDEEIFTYVQGVLENGASDFESADDVYDAIGEFLSEAAGYNKDERDIIDICSKLHKILVGDGACTNGDAHRVLEAPVHLSQMGNNYDEVEEPQSIWMMTRDNPSRVDPRKLEKAEAKLKEKQDKRTTDKPPPQVITLNMTATASQMISKKDNRMESKGSNNTRDIRIENFDVTVGNASLIKGADLSLVSGRRYGLVGRNGLGKTTLLSMISNGSLRIPSHITVLHVEQEVTGDETPALQSVLECDLVREGLLHEERELTAKMNAGCTDSPELQARLNQVYEELQKIDSDKAPARASVILAGLGFTPAMQIRHTREFSGGWRMRLALARALFSLPDLLLLDEPTNMLDIKAIIWLENYLQNWPSTLLVVSHDRNFLDVVPTDIIFLHSQRLESYRGNYDNFIKSKTEKHRNQQREWEAQQAFRAHVQEFIDKFRYNANRAALVQSKIKMLEKLPELQAVEKETGVTLRFTDPEALTPPILQLDEVSFGYIPDHKILVNVDLTANMESRICIVGDNGAGKTTLLKILLGDLNPVSGLRHSHRNLRIGYFSQHHVDQLEMSVSAIELLATRYPGKPVEDYRRQLGCFGISGDLALQPVTSLSGGQKSRVAFAAMCMISPNFFVLDEPTNHLDVETIEALAKALHKFKGGVVLVSHDERLIRSMCSELWVCSNGTVTCIQGGFDEYRRIVEAELEAQTRGR